MWPYNRQSHKHLISDIYVTILQLHESSIHTSTTNCFIGCIYYSINIYLSNASMTKRYLRIYIIIYLKFHFLQRLQSARVSNWPWFNIISAERLYCIKENILYLWRSSNLSITVVTKIKRFWCSFIYYYFLWTSTWRFTIILCRPWILL